MKGNFKKFSALFLAVLFALSLSACSFENFSVGKLYDVVFNNGEKENSADEPSSKQESEVNSEDSEENHQEESENIEIVFPSDSDNQETEVEIELESAIEETEETEETEEIPFDEEAAIPALNSLLLGFDYDIEGNKNEFDDDAVIKLMACKLLWGDYLFGKDPYLNKAGVKFTSDSDGYAHYNLEDVKNITKDALGIDFPSASNSDYRIIDEDEFLIMPAIGESTTLSVQKAVKDGSAIFAYGTAIDNHSSFCEFRGYFQAEFIENPSSVYGYTLTSIYKISGNQNFKELKATASSVLIEEGDDYNPANLIDCDVNTAWVEGVKGVGSGEWIKIETTDGSKLNISAIEFNVGFQRDERLLKNNGWPSKVLMEFESGYTQIAYLYNCYSTSAIMLEKPQNTSFVKITILDAVKGAKYDDTCITEITLLGLD